MHTLPPVLTLRVDERRLISEFGKLFGSPADALAEVVQNAYRARAKHLRVEVDSDGHTLTFTDDGLGLNDPELLFDIARTGWDDGVAADPAGMGAIALFALCDHVVITSRPTSAPAWRVEFGPEVFAGASFVPERLPASVELPGLSIRATFKPDVDVTLLLASSWRHRYPVHVTLARDGMEEVVPPAPPAEGITVDTLVGPITLSRRSGNRTRSLAVWEYRLVEFSGEDIVSRIAARLPQTLAGAVVMRGLYDMYVEWTVDTGASRVSPRLPDRTHMIDDAALDSALDLITEALLAEVDEDRLTQLALDHIGTREILRAHEDGGWFSTPGAIGSLGSGVPLATALPFLGFCSAERALPAESISVSLWICGDEDNSEWGGISEPVWVRPRYRTDGEAAAALALADGIAAAAETRTPEHTAGLPLLTIEADSLVAAVSIGQIFATNLRYRVGGEDLGPVQHVYTRRMTDHPAHTALAPRWRRVIDTLSVGPDDRNAPYDPSRDWYWLGLHPLPSGVTPIEYIRTSSRFEMQALAESDYDEWPVYFWDYASAARRETDAENLVNDLIARFARELGPITAYEVERETVARQLAKTCGHLATRITSKLVTRAAWTADGNGGHAYMPRRALAAEMDHWGLAPDLLGEIQDAAMRLCDLLGHATPARLLERGAETSRPRPALPASHARA